MDVLEALVSPEQVWLPMNRVDGNPSQDIQGSSALYNLYDKPSIIKVKTKGGPFFGCSALRVVEFLACLPVVGASSASAPGSSTSGMPSTLQIFSYVAGSATVIGMILAFIACCLKCYHRSQRGPGVLGALDVLIRPFRERLAGGLYMSVDSLEVGEAKVNGLIFDSRV